MKASELRIGNIVQYNGSHKEIGIVSEISKNSLTEVSPYKVGINHRLDIYYNIHTLSPIPLTEEWLKKLGFTWSEGLRMNVIKDGITVCEPDDYEDSVYHSIYFYHNGECFGFEVSNEWGENGNVMLPKVKYVHQLQNLIFALTGEELTIKE